GNVYLEGGSTWGFDSPTDLHSPYFFPVTASAGAAGIYPGPVEGKHFCHGLDFAVTQNPVLASAIDTLQKKAGSAAIPVLTDGAAGGFEVAVSYESGIFGSRTVAASLPFAALASGATRNALMDRYLDFFEEGYPPCPGSAADKDEYCNDSEICTLDQCLGGACENENLQDCIPCEDDRPCTALGAARACKVTQGLCAVLAGTPYPSTGPAIVLDGNTVQSAITVPGSGTVQNVQVQVRITHGYRGDLTLTLSHAGHTVTLLEADPTDNGHHVYATFDFGVLVPDNDMDVFDGGGENGAWMLTVTDVDNGFTGALQGWKLFIVTEADEPCNGNGDCDDGNGCTVDSCVMDVCVYVEDPCDEVDACQWFSHCDPDTGCIYVPTDCNDGNPCTADSCNTITGCAHATAKHCTAPCTSHKGCGTDDWCDLSGGSPGVCAPVPQDQTLYCPGCPIPVGDLSTVTSTITSTDTAHYLGDLFVKVHLAHSSVGQLSVTLNHDGVPVLLHAAEPDPADDLVRVYEISPSDYTATPLALDGFLNRHPAGSWTLTVTDTVAGDVGAVLYWTLFLSLEDLLVSGLECGHADMCQSNYCGNGFCCVGTGSGDCCATAADCDGYAVPSVCDSEATCQGHRVDAVCTSFECDGASVMDDSGCAGETAAPCGDCRPVPTCSALQNQDDPMVRCPLCVAHTTCNEECWCSAGSCVPDGGAGDPCTGDQACGPGLHCQNGVCCALGKICCTSWDDCPDGQGGYNPLTQVFSPPVCDGTPGPCDGTMYNKVCSSAACGSLLVQDDSACGSDRLFDHCGPYPTVNCNGAKTQTPACATSCDEDGDCDLTAHCTLGQCVPDYENGHGCDG
ncbi:MAG: proprotein convertase P-domain-containing protein, partial [Deltaproteobacteria bacterium]|nr:proprotein convertase P-domain-containing protein [Deltaproteobacteria bacterium]